MTVLAILLLSGLSNAAPVPPGGGTHPPGGGTHGPGAADVPLDMYIYALLAIAVSLIIFFVKKNQKNMI